MSRYDLEQLGTIGDALHNLWDAAEGQHKIAQEQQRTAQAAIGGVNAATASLRDTAKSLKGELAKEVHDALEDASTKAAGLLTKNFVEANRQAALTVDTYRSVVHWASWKVFLFATVLSALTVAAGTYVLLRSIPTYDEIQKLRAEKAQLESTINVFEKKGGQAVVARCPSPGHRERMCVHVMDGSTGETYWMVIDGY